MNRNCVVLSNKGTLRHQTRVLNGNYEFILSPDVSKCYHYLGHGCAIERNNAYSVERFDDSVRISFADVIVGIRFTNDCSITINIGSNDSVEKTIHAKFSRAFFVSKDELIIEMKDIDIRLRISHADNTMVSVIIVEETKP